MPEEIYGVNGVVEHSFYKGKEYVIYAFKTHPCAYVLLTEKDPDYRESYDNIGLLCHGGLTYSAETWKTNIHWFSEGWVIGWDYAHLGDYHYIEHEKIKGIPYEAIQSTKYTRARVRGEIFKVVDALTMKRNWKLLYR